MTTTSSQTRLGQGCLGLVFLWMHWGDDDEVKKTKESDGGGDSDMHETDALYDAVLEHVVHSPGHAAYTFPR